MFTDTAVDKNAIESLYDDVDNGEPVVAHLCDSKQKVLAAYVNGTPLVALCGHVFVPSRDPDNYPICQKCWEVFKVMTDNGRHSG